MIERILLILRAKKITNAEYSRMVNKSRQQIGNVLTGSSNMGISFLIDFIKAIPDANMNYVLKNTGSMLLEKVEGEEEDYIKKINEQQKLILSQQTTIENLTDITKNIMK